MKLVYCQKCQGIIRLRNIEKQCDCGLTKGKYIDNLNAVFSGEFAIPMGVDNNSFREALLIYNDMNFQYGPNFKAFIITEPCKTFKRKKK